MASINEEELALRQLLAQTNKEILETQEECNLLAELILRKKLKNIAEYRAAIVPITGRGSRNKNNFDSKDAKDKKKRERKSDGVTGSAKKAKKSGDKSEDVEGTLDEPIVSINNDETENDIIQEENSFKNKEENIASS